MLSIILFQSVGLAWLYVSTRPPVVYLVLDATERSQPYFNEVIRSVQLASQTQADNTRSGLRIYGGGEREVMGCGDSIQLIEPVPTKDYKQKLNQTLLGIAPKGNSSLTIAVLKSIKDDLKQYKGPIKLIVVTAGVDPRCEPLGGGIFEEIAGDVRENTRDDITIAIVGVGSVATQEETVLKRYAAAFGGIYLPAIDTTDLSAIILAPPSYLLPESNINDNQ